MRDMYPYYTMVRFYVWAFDSSKYAKQLLNRDYKTFIDLTGRLVVSLKP